jgi:hypothetical protein
MPPLSHAMADKNVCHTGGKPPKVSCTHAGREMELWLKTL